METREIDSEKTTYNNGFVISSRDEFNESYSYFNITLIKFDNKLWFKKKVCAVLLYHND
jgi:hypothetical protein